MIIIFIFSVSFFAPDLFAFSIDNHTKIVLTEFQKSKQYSYVLINIVALNAIIILVQVLLNIAVINAFRKFNRNKMNLRRITSILANKNATNCFFKNFYDMKLKKATINFIQMTLMQGFLFTFVRLLYLSTVLFDSIESLEQFYNKSLTFYLCNIWLILEYIAQGSNFCILIFFNKTFRKSICS